MNKPQIKQKDLEMVQSIIDYVYWEPPAPMSREERKAVRKKRKRKGKNNL